MKIPPLWIACAAALAGLGRAAGEPPASPSAPEPWLPGTPVEVWVAPGRATTVLLRTPRKVSAISAASPIVTYRYDKALNQLELTPAVRSGGVETNLNLRIGAEIYVLLVKVVEDARVQAVRALAPAGEADAAEDGDLARSRPLKPADLDLVAASQALERFQADPVFRQAHPELGASPIARLYVWNGCIVELADVMQFALQDLLVFRVRWVNRTAQALHLEAGQYRLRAGGRDIPVTARYESGPGPTVYPGQLETVFLAVQGYRLSRDNDWGLALPPDADAVERMLRRG